MLGYGKEARLPGVDLTRAREVLGADHCSPRKLETLGQLGAHSTADLPRLRRIITTLPRRLRAQLATVLGSEVEPAKASPDPCDHCAFCEFVSDLFDAIVVDEAQDFGDLWWTSVLACLKDPVGGKLYAFMDKAQRVFSREGEVPIDLPPYPLDENIRNTKRIAQLFSSLSGEAL